MPLPTGSTSLSRFQNRLALHTWTVDTTPLPDALRAARDAGFNAVEMRYVDFKRCIERGMTHSGVIEMIQKSGVKVAVVGAEAGLIFARGDEQSRLLDSFERTCANAVALNCGMLMISPGQNPEGTVREGAANLKLAGGIAQQHGVRLALEFNSRHPLLNRIEVAREMIALAALPSCGLLLDTYHLHFSGAPGRSFEDVPGEEIFAFQFSDAPPGPPSSVRSPTDRLPPGKGVVQWTEVLQLLMEKDYRGYLDYEAPNPAQWSRPPDEVAREGITAVRALLAVAEASALQRP